MNIMSKYTVEQNNIEGESQGFKNVFTHLHSFERELE